MQLDVSTLILITTLLCLLLALVMVMLRRSYPPSIQGLKEWALAMGLSFLATLVFMTRGKLPDFVSMALAYGVVYSALAMFYRGCELFLNLKPKLWPWALAVPASVLVLGWFVSVRQSYLEYAVVATGLSAVFYSTLLLLLLRKAPRQFATLFTASVLLIQIATSTFGSLAFAFQAVPFGVFDPVTVRAVAVAVMSLSFMGVGVGLILMTTERLRTELEHMASHDSLTGALTRRVMADACNDELERFKRQGHAIALLMIDLDYFKKINDTHGHFVGDKVLVDFVERVRSNLRRVDRLGRFGGEEFIVMLPETGLEQALIVAERIRHATCQAITPGLPNYTVSIGLTVTTLEDVSMDLMLKRADAALYRAKAAGRNRIEVG